MPMCPNSLTWSLELGPQAFQEDCSAWTVCVMSGFSRTLRKVAEAADAQIVQKVRQQLADCPGMLLDQWPGMRCKDPGLIGMLF